MSTFTYETVRLAEEAAWGLVTINLAGTIAACLAGTWLGRAAGLALWSGGV
jgi:fluoride ion exporter CrcB/FEX